MNENRVLVAYATRGGVSAEVALKIADVLRSRGFEVEVVNLRDKPSPDLSRYRHVVVGGGVRAQRVYKEVVDFLKCHNFEGKNVALFILALEAGNPKTHPKAVTKYVEALLKKCPRVKPVAAEAFGGRIRFLGFTIADTLDLGKVKAWAESLGEKLRGKP